MEEEYLIEVLLSIMDMCVNGDSRTEIYLKAEEAYRRIIRNI